MKRLVGCGWCVCVLLLIGFMDLVWYLLDVCVFVVILCVGKFVLGCFNGCWYEFV